MINKPRILEVIRKEWATKQNCTIGESTTLAVVDTVKLEKSEEI